MTNLISSLKTPYSKTHNNALALPSTNFPLLDLNYSVPELRRLAIQENNTIIWDKFSKAYKDNPIYTLKWLLYLRDIKDGLGEREAFKNILIQLSKYNIEIALKLFKLPLESFGRFDDILSIYDKVNSGIQGVILNKIQIQLDEDLSLMKESKPISLLAKWMPSINTSSHHSKSLANLLAKDLHLSPKQYRKTLSTLRKYLNVLECNISSNNFDNIDYSKIPAIANMKYTKLFHKKDFINYSSYINEVKSNKSNINATNLTPQDIIHKYKIISQYNETLEQLWKLLPPPSDNLLIMKDDSQSMLSKLPHSSLSPSDIADAFSLYYNKPFISFSDDAHLISIPPNLSLFDKLNYIKQFHSFKNTDIIKPFELLIKNPSLIPDTILIISDMQFDDTCNQILPFDYISSLFSKYALKLPKIVFWNVSDTSNTIPMIENKNGLVLISGLNKLILNNVPISSSPYDFLIDTLNNPKYDIINDLFE